MSDSTLSIGVLLPGVLGTYSDSGNAEVLAQRARWRGIDAQVHHVSASDVPPATCELYLLGGGEDLAQQFAISWLRRFPALLTALDTSATTLAVCAGMQILGTTVTDAHGEQHAGVGLLDASTCAGSTRIVGEVVTQCVLPCVGLLTGFENHLGVTTLGPGAAPLSHVIRGTGNGGTGGERRPVDGALTDHIVATYLHGPVLARNPELADHLLHRATGQPLPECELPDQAALRRTYLSNLRRPRRHLRWIRR